MRNLFLAVFLACFLTIVFVVVRYSLRARRLRNNSWESLVERIFRLNAENVALVALDLIEEDGTLRRSEIPELSADQVWNLVGGMDGLERIEANCEIFIEIAMYLQTAYPGALLIAEEFRSKTRHIQWHINRLRAGGRNGNLTANFPAYAQRAVASYYLMSKQLVELCEQTHFDGLDQLRVAI